MTHRQRPATAGGTTFVNLEDETGLVNVVVSKGCWARHRQVVQTAPALLVRGRLENAEGVVNVIAETALAPPAERHHALPGLPLIAPAESSGCSQLYARGPAWAGGSSLRSTPAGQRRR